MNRDVSPIFSTQWHLRALLGTHLFAFTLLGSFVLPEGHALWRSLDASVFYSLNGSLAEGGDWARFWAWANVRASDLVAGVVILATLTFPGLGLRRSQLQPGFVGFVFLLLFVMFPIRYTLYKWALANGYSGNSPSITLEPAYRLSELAPDIPAKDKSGRSFPGDHATVLWCWLGVMAFNMKRKALIVIPAVLAVLFMLPRVVGGAHWASDTLVGGGFAAMLTLSWAFHTPLVQKATDAIHFAVRPLINLVGRLPVIGRLPFFNPQS